MINNEIKVYNKDGSELIGSLTQVVSCEAEEERNGLFEVVLTSPLTEPLFFSLAKENIIVCKPNDIQELQAFRIYNVGKFMNSMSIVYARHISFDLAGDLVDKVSLVNASCEYALNSIFRQSQYCKHYRGYSDIINAQDYNMELSNCLEAIAGKEGSIIDTYGNGAEILRDNTNIHVLNRRGNDNGVTIEYGKNMTGFEFIEDVDGLTTVIKPYCTIRNEDGTESILRGELVWADNWAIFSHPYITPIDYSDKFAEGETPTKEKLKKFAEQEFLVNKIHIPNANYKIEFIALSKCVGYEDIEDRISICDTVTIKDHRYGINTKAKVIKYKYDVLTQKYITMEIGEPRTTLGDIITAKDGQDGKDGQNGKDGKDGQDGKPADVEDMPDTLPEVPVLTPKVFGMGSVELNWTFENKLYYTYELYASKIKDFTPNIFDLVHAGQSSSFMFKALPNETWYFKVCAANSHNRRTGFSNQVEVSLPKIEDLNNYFSEIAIGHAVAQSITADYMEAGIFKGHWIDARNLSVTDGNGKRTLDIDSFGRLSMMPTVFKLLVNGEEQDVITESRFEVTRDEILFQVGNSSIPNLLPNGKPTVGNPAGWYASDGAWIYTAGLAPSDSIGVAMTEGREGYAWTEFVPVKPNTTYTVSAKILAEGNTKGGDVFVIGSQTTAGEYAQIVEFVNAGPNQEKQGYRTFVTGRDIRYIRLRIDNNGYNGAQPQGGFVVWMKEFMVLEGAYNTPNYRPSANQILNNVVRVNNEGMEIIHGNNSRAKFTHEAIDFLNSQGRRTLRVKDGGLNFYTFGDPAEMVGFIKSSYRANTSWNGVSLSTYGHGDYIAIGTSSSMDENGWNSDPNIIITPHANIAGLPYRGTHFVNNDVIFHNLIRVLSGSTLSFYANSETSHLMFNSTQNKFCIMGDNNVTLGIRYGTDNKTLMELGEDGNQLNKGYGHNWINWDWHGHRIYNMNSAYSLEPQSQYLKARVKDVNDAHGIYSMTEGEIRYTERSPQHISNKTAIIELPQILAENIELDYHVNISKLSWGDYRIVDKNPYYFEIETNVEDFSFTFEVVAKLIEKPSGNTMLAREQYHYSEVGDKSDPIECVKTDN